jgi:hypothetical protein
VVHFGRFCRVKLTASSCVCTVLLGGQLGDCRLWLTTCWAYNPRWVGVPRSWVIQVLSVHIETQPNGKGENIIKR